MNKYFLNLLLACLLGTSMTFISCDESEDPDPGTPPTAGFSYTVDELEVTFSNTSLGATSYSWDFGDDSNSTEINPSHTYAGDGTFEVVLTAYNGELTDTETMSVTVKATPIPVEVNTFHTLGTIDGAYYLAPTDNLSSGNLSFVDNGTQLEADQAARIITSGNYLYSLNYGSGILTQLKLMESGEYTITKEINAGLSVGTNRPRFKLANETTIMVYNVTVEPVKDSNDDIVDNTCTLRLASISIPELSIANLTEFVIPQSENAKMGGTIGYHPMRVDGPVISGDKIYFGLMHLDMSDPTIPPPFRKPKQTGLETLVFDFPSFDNGKVVESDQASGHTSGYRAPAMHVDENGDVYQSNWFMAANSFDLSGGDKTVISRLKDGDYDDSYLFNVSEALGLSTNAATVGWFYVGNGIGYMPIQMESEGHYFQENSWTLARVDVYNKTATRMSIPNAQLFSYENGVVYDGKFYMAIGPIGGDAYVYEFDPTSDSPDAFTTGLELDGANLQVDGVYTTVE
jgi:PKD repeat protein